MFESPKRHHPFLQFHAAASFAGGADQLCPYSGRLRDDGDFGAATETILTPGSSANWVGYLEGPISCHQLQAVNVGGSAQAKPRNARCSAQSIGKLSARNRRRPVKPIGCRPSIMAETISGASQPIRISCQRCRLL